VIGPRGGATGISPRRRRQTRRRFPPKYGTRSEGFQSNNGKRTCMHRLLVCAHTFIRSIRASVSLSNRSVRDVTSVTWFDIMSSLNTGHVIVVLAVESAHPISSDWMTRGFLTVPVCASRVRVIQGNRIQPYSIRIDSYRSTRSRHGKVTVDPALVMRSAHSNQDKFDGQAILLYRGRDKISLARIQ